MAPPTAGSSTPSETGELDALRTSSCWELTEWDLATGVADGAPCRAFHCALAPRLARRARAVLHQPTYWCRARAAGTKGEHVLSPDGAIGAEFRLLKQAEAEALAGKGPGATPCARARRRRLTRPPSHRPPLRVAVTDAR